MIRFLSSLASSGALLGATLALSACDKDSATDSRPALSLSCEDPTPEPHASTGATTGYLRCANGGLDRISAETFALPEDLQRCEDASLDPADHGGLQSCNVDSDCGSGSYCKVSWSDLGLWTCGCAPSPCTQDSDCGAGEVCMPRIAGNMSAVGAACRPAACATGEDCASGACGVYVAVSSDVGCFSDQWGALACRSEGDACRGSGDHLPNCGICGEGFSCVEPPTDCD